MEALTTIVTQLGMGGAFVFMAREYRRERKRGHKERKAWRESVDQLRRALSGLQSEVENNHQNDS